MKSIRRLASATLIASAGLIQAQTLLQSIVSPDKAVAVVNQTLEGTWLSELRPPTLPPTAPSILLLVTFSENGTGLASSSDGTQGLARSLGSRGRPQVSLNHLRLRLQ